MLECLTSFEEMSFLQLGSLGRGSDNSHPQAAAWPPLGRLVHASTHPYSTRGTALSPRERQWWHRAYANKRKELSSLNCHGPAADKPHFLVQTGFILAPSLFGAAAAEKQTPGEGSFSKRHARGWGFCVLQPPWGLSKTTSRPGRWDTDRK